MRAKLKSVGGKIYNFFRYGIGYIGRWVFIGIAFIYLISLTIALHEAISFQRSVEGMFTEKSTAQRVLVELYNHLSSDGSPPEKTYPVPIGTMAIRLDALKNAVQEIGNYQLDNQPRAADANPVTLARQQPGDNPTNPSADEKLKELNKIKEEFKIRIDALQPALNNLHKLLFENSTHLEIVETFLDLEEIAEDLEQFSIEVPDTDDSADITHIALHQVSIEDRPKESDQAFSPPTTEKSGTHDTKLPPEQEATQPEDRRVLIDNYFESQAAAEYDVLIGELAGNIKELAAEVDTVKSDLSEETLEAYSNNVKVIEEEIDALEKHRAAANNFNTSIAKLTNLVHALNEDMLDDRQKFNQDLFNSIQSRLQQLEYFHEAKALRVTRHAPGASDFKIQEASDSKVGSTADGYAAALHGLSSTVIALEQNIARTNEYKEIVKLKQIAMAINRMKAAAKSINDLSTQGAPASRAKTDLKSRLEDEARTVQLMFEKNLGALSDAIIELEKEFSAQKPAAMLALIIGNDPQAQSKANTILTDYQSLSAFDAVLLPFQSFIQNKDHYFHNFGINTRYIITLSRESVTLMFVFVIGAIGSLLYITKYFLHQAIQGHGWLDPPSRPFSWYLFRPIFGIVVALAVYLLVKAGQFALGGGESLGNLNISIFSVVALFAGLLSWHALDAIESRGKKWFQAQSRRHMYATGLEHALKIKNIKIDECAKQIGYTEEQINRWISFKDKVTPEMQDRLITWLDLPIGELFGDEAPPQKDGNQTTSEEGTKEDDPDPGKK